MSRPYIIINNVSSSSIGGLLVTELSPISKPPKRVVEEEIDGKDGSIITEIGYGSYDKTFSIGLYGTYDIDEVIEFFDTTGSITFSNEPNKYYHFTTIEQIDFEKLLRFKTCEITIRVQPFKFLTTEQPTTYSEPATITVNNAGNTTSKPLMTITGKGEVTVSLNGVELFDITFSEDEYETYLIDTEQLNAFNVNTGVLVNRNIIGGYDLLKLNKGNNTIVIDGDCSTVILNKVTRFI